MCQALETTAMKKKQTKPLEFPPRGGKQISITESYKYKRKFGMIIKTKNI